MSTWGSLRLRLQKQFPGADIDLIDSALNERYEQVLEACNWTGTTYHTTLQTIAAYQSGQQGMNPQPGEDAADLMVGNAIVNIINTPGQNPVVGMKFYVPGDTVIYTIVAVSLGATAGAITGASVGAGGSSFLLNQILNVVQGTATGGQVQVSALGANGSVAAVTIYAGGVPVLRRQWPARHERGGSHHHHFIGQWQRRNHRLDRGCRRHGPLSSRASPGDRTGGRLRRYRHRGVGR